MVNYKILTTKKEIYTLIDNCKKTGYCCHDFETTNTTFYEKSTIPTIIGIGFQPGFSYIIPLGHYDSPFKHEYPKILRLLGRELINNEKIVKIAWNLKYEYKWWLKYGIIPKGVLLDGMLAKYLLDEERPMGLKEMVDRFMPERAGYRLPGSNSEKFDWSKPALEELSKYCAIDVDSTFKLTLWFEQKLQEKKFYPLFRNLLMMATRVLAESEFRGILVDKPYLEGLVDIYKEKIRICEEELMGNRRLRKYQLDRMEERKQILISKIQEEIKKGGTPKYIAAREEKIKRYIQGIFITKDELKVKEEVNLSSPKQLIELLYTNHKGFKFPIIKYTKDKKTKKETSTPSTDEEVLLVLQKKDKTGFIEKLLEHRGLTKLYSTYIIGIYEKLSSISRIHTGFLIHGTVTGRLSSVNPNMQNIPRGCIKGDTLVYTNKGLVPIDTFLPETPGEYPNPLRVKVLTHKHRYREVESWINKGYQDMLKITFDTGQTLVCTPDHRLLTHRGWKKVKDIIKYNYECRSFKTQRSTISTK